MSKFVCIDIKSDSCVIVGGKAELGRIIDVSVPTITKWFSDRSVYLYADKILALSCDKPIKKEDK